MASIGVAAKHVDDRGTQARNTAMSLQCQQRFEVRVPCRVKEWSLPTFVANIHMAAEAAGHEIIDNACITLAELSSKYECVSSVGLHDADIRSGSTTSTWSFSKARRRG
eukprot:3001320-Prymnesium_polylepis.2